MWCGAVCVRGAIVDDQPRLAGKYLLAIFKKNFGHLADTLAKKGSISGLLARCKAGHLL